MKGRKTEQMERNINNKEEERKGWKKGE